MLPQRNWRDLIKPKKLEAEDKSLTATYGKFVGEPFERGFGVTVGNSLRRILLSSLQGAAISAVRIRGVLHEFSTLPGVREDVTDLVLNLKEVRLKLHDGTEEIARIEAKGDGEVKAGDIKAGPNLEILNPDLHLASLSKEGKLEMDLTIKTGRGYMPAERNKDENAPVGTIPIDAIFSPSFISSPTVLIPAFLRQFEDLAESSRSSMLISSTDSSTSSLPATGMPRTSDFFPRLTKRSMCFARTLADSVTAASGEMDPFVHTSTTSRSYFISRPTRISSVVRFTLSTGVNIESTGMVPIGRPCFLLRSAGT